jgi:hypothetical protein
MQSGHITEDYLVRLVDRLSGKAAPSTNDARAEEVAAARKDTATEDGTAGGEVAEDRDSAGTNEATYDEGVPKAQGMKAGAFAVFEVFCHPTQGGESRPLGPNPGDLQALLSPAVRAAVDAGGVLLTTYLET